MPEQKYNFKKIGRRLIIFISLGIAAHLAFLFYTTEAGTFSRLRELSFGHLIIIALLALGPWVCHALRIMLWSRFVDYPLGFSDSLAVVITNDLGSSLTPTAIGGGPIKLGMLMAKGMPGAKATFLVLLSASEDLVFYTTGILLSAYYMQDGVSALFDFVASKENLIYGVVGIVAASIILPRFGINIWKPIGRLIPQKVKEFLGSIPAKIAKSIDEIKGTYARVLKTAKLKLLLSIFLLFMQWFTKFGILYVILHALGIDLSMFEVIIKQWMTYMSMLLVPTPGASGGAEAIFLALFGDTLQGNERNLVVSTWRFFTYYYVMFLSLVLFQFLGPVSLSRNPEENIPENQ